VRKFAARARRTECRPCEASPRQPKAGKQTAERAPRTSVIVPALRTESLVGEEWSRVNKARKTKRAVSCCVIVWSDFADTLARVLTLTS